MRWNFLANISNYSLHLSHDMSRGMYVTLPSVAMSMSHLNNSYKSAKKQMRCCNEWLALRVFNKLTVLSTFHKKKPSTYTSSIACIYFNYKPVIFSRRHFIRKNGFRLHFNVTSCFLFYCAFRIQGNNVFTGILLRYD